MSENERDPRIDEYNKSFGPKERARAVLALLFEFKDKMNELDIKDQQVFEGKISLLVSEVNKEENGDEKLIMGLTSEIKGFLLDKLDCPDERLEHDSLIQFYIARINAERQKRYLA